MFMFVLLNNQQSVNVWGPSSEKQNVEKSTE